YKIGILKPVALACNQLINKYQANLNTSAIGILTTQLVHASFMFVYFEDDFCAFSVLWRAYIHIIAPIKCKCLINVINKKILTGKWVPFCCTLGDGVDLGLRITYEELCIKFSTQKKSKYFENQITIYDLYYLNNNKYQKSFEAKPLFNAVLKIYGESCTKFSKLSYKRKNFYDFPTTKLLANFSNFDIFQQLIRNLVLNFQDFLVSQKFFIQDKKFDFDEN
ncbi:hypothetical protein AGLY_009137, partial [Aphis glycines]